MQTSALLMSGVMLASLPISLPSGGKDFTRDRKPPQQVVEVMPKTDKQVMPVGDNAFGEIRLNGAEASGKGGGGGGNASVNTGNAKSETTEADIMPVPYQPINYEYVYEGELTLPTESELPVYKRVSEGTSGKGMAGLVKSLNLGLINASELEGLDIQQVTLSDNKEMGYVISLDLANESISVFQDYTRWPNPMNECWKTGISPEQSQACIQKNALQPEDVPADDRLIAVARDFLKDYGIGTEGFGQPYVLNDWKRYYEQAKAQQDAASTEEKMMYMPWVPDQIQVVFPQLFDGATAYDAGGNPLGLMVTVDVRTKKGAGLFNLTTQRYEASSYPVESDEQKIREIMARGGIYPSWNDPEAKEVKKIKLQDPKRGYIQHYNYDGIRQHELSVPALIFAVEPASLEEGVYFYPQTVIVPLVKDAIDLSQYPPILYDREASSDDGAAVTASPTATPSPSASPTKSTKASPSPKVTATPATTKKATPKASPTVSPKASASPSPTSTLKRF